jgi:2-polyprenyl-3-methyl-5-hydroxy-6-metoxy-1,4-benzoquinol methylase
MVVVIPVMVLYLMSEMGRSAHATSCASPLLPSGDDPISRAPCQLTAVESEPRPEGASGTEVVPCLSCGSPSHYASSLAHTSVYRCSDRACRLQFAHPQPTDDGLARVYEEVFSEVGAPNNHGATPASYARVLLEALAARIGPLAGRRVLDFGAGVGTIAGLLIEAGADVVAVELNAAGRDQIRGDLDIPAVANLEQVRALDDRRPFDAVIMVEVIEHLRDPRADLVELQGLLREGGHIFLTTPNVASLKSRLQGARWPNVSMQTHLVYFDRRSLRAMLHAAGFTDVEPLAGASLHPNARLRAKLFQLLLHPLNLDGGLQVVARSR